MGKAPLQRALAPRHKHISVPDTSTTACPFLTLLSSSPGSDTVQPRSSSSALSEFAGCQGQGAEGTGTALPPQPQRDAAQGLLSTGPDLSSRGMGKGTSTLWWRMLSEL